MRKIVLMLLVLGLVVSGISKLQAQQPNPPQARKQQQHEKMSGKLNLSDTQKKQIEEMRTALQRNTVQLRSKIQLARIDLRELLRSDDPDKSAIEKKMNDIGQLQTELKILKISHWLDIRKILTPEQRKIIKTGFRGAWFRGREFKRNHRGMMREHPGMMENYHGRMGRPEGMIEDRHEMSGGALGMSGNDESMTDDPQEFVEYSLMSIDEPDDPMDIE